MALISIDKGCTAWPIICECSCSSDWCSHRFVPNGVMKACHGSIVVRAAEAVGGMQVKLTQLLPFPQLVKTAMMQF